MYKNYKNVELVKPAGLDLKDRLVGIQRVTKVTKGGRAFGFSAIVVVGDENGVVGHGLGKAKEVTIAISKAVEDAKKNLVRIPIDNGTLPHEQKGKFGGAKVFIKPATEGTGVIAGGAVRTVLEAVGVQNVLSKSQGSSNPHNVVKATFDALLNLRSPLMISKQRGISLDKVFKPVIILESNTKELEWYHDLSSWDGYTGYFASEESKTIQRPYKGLLKYHEWNGLGVENANKDNIGDTEHNNGSTESD